MGKVPILFSRKIKCAHCGKNFKSKMERRRRVYICSSYDNYNLCERVVIPQGLIVDLINRRSRRVLTEEDVRGLVELIEIESANKFKIHLKDQEPIIFGDNFIHY